MRAPSTDRRLTAALLGGSLWLLAGILPAVAQGPPSDTRAPAAVTIPAPPPPGSAVPASAAPSSAPAATAPGATSQAMGSVPLEAVLTDDGQRIDRDLVWRVFSPGTEAGARPKLVATYRDGMPVLRLPPGDYQVNVAYGRANLTRRLIIKPGDGAPERFVLNAGGLKVSTKMGGGQPPPASITYAIQSEDTAGNRTLVVAGLKPGVIVRLNAGIYHIVSTLGDANAVVRADVTVEAGKLTDVALTHTAAKVAFKLVTQPGGDAVADTQWSIQTMGGEIVKESVGAIPTHTLAPGTYAAIARKGGRAFRRDFLIRHGETVQVEVVMQ